MQEVAKSAIRPKDQGQSALHEVSMYLSRPTHGAMFVRIVYAAGLDMQL